MKKLFAKILNWWNNLSACNKSFIDGLVFMFFSFCAFIGVLKKSNIFFDDIIPSWMLAIIGIAGIVFFIIRSILGVMSKLKQDVGLVYLPIIFVLLPLFLSDLSNKVSILISVVLTVIFIIFTVKKVPKELKQIMILEWKKSNSIILLILGVFTFISFFLPDIIMNTPIDKLKELMNECIFGSIFILVILQYIISKLEYNIEIQNLNSNQNH